MKKNIFLIIILQLLFSITCFATKPFDAYEIQAGFLYKFLFFTEWPEEVLIDNEAPIIIGILGEDPFGEVFKKIEGISVGERKLTIKRFDKNTTFEVLRQCRILFINPSLKTRVKELLESLKKYSVVTVSELNGFTNMGGMINFIRTEDLVTFEINRAAAETVGIKFSSKLLRIAVRVIED